jgi:lipopolysaccharide biosynthesis regulator YciM
MGDIAATKLRDATYAAKNYLTALSESPNDRKILMKLMQLYSEEKDWRKLVRVVLKLSDFVDDNKQKAKYLHTAAMVAYKEMGDVDRALENPRPGARRRPEHAGRARTGARAAQGQGRLRGRQAVAQAQGQGPDRGR